MQSLINTAMRAITPDPQLTYFQWAEKYYILPPSASAKGLINFAYTPYLVEPLENFSWNSPIKEEWWMKATQLAITEHYVIIQCGSIDYFPCPIIGYHGSNDMGIEYAKLRLEPCIDVNQRLRDKVSDGRDKSGKSTRSLKIFQGGSIKNIGGITEKAFRSFSAAIVLFDDVDALPRDIDGTEKRKGQGSPIDLGRGRTKGRQGKYKIGVSGSPTDTETSLIYNGFKDTDQRYFHVPCPFCSTMQVIDYWRIKYEKKNDEFVKVNGLECISCNKIIPEVKKFEIMQLENDAKWIAMAESKNPLIVGRHMSSTYSLIGYTWEDMCRSQLKASNKLKLGDSGPMRTFYNTELGIPWDDYKEKKKIKHTDLYDQMIAENITVLPPEAAIITTGIDIQANRIEVLVCAFAENAHVYCLEYKVIGGDTLIKYGLDGSPFNGLEKFLQKTYENSWGNDQPILHNALDMGFHSVTASPFLYKYTANIEIVGVFGTSTKNKKKMFVGEPKENKYGVNQFEINVDEGKTMNHHKLKSGMIHFVMHPSFTDSAFRQLTVERWDEKDQRWVCPDHARNELTDCLNYATADFEIYSNGGKIDWPSFQSWNKTGCQITGSNEMTVVNQGERI